MLSLGSPGSGSLPWSALPLLIAQEEVAVMSSIIVRGLDDHVKQQLASQAKEPGRSVEAEVRDILTKAARRLHIGSASGHGAGCRWVDELSISTRDDAARVANFE